MASFQVKGLLVAALMAVAWLGAAGAMRTIMEEDEGDFQPDSFIMPSDGDAPTKLAMVGSKEALRALGKDSGHIIIDSSALLDGIADSDADDIEEDEHDRFISTASGKPRPTFSAKPDALEWARDEHTATAAAATTSDGQRILSRKKRCGGGNGGNDANRARRARRARRAQRRNAQRQASRQARRANKTTTITRTVLQNGQVVSQTTHDANAAALPAATVLQQGSQPVLLQQQQQPLAVQSLAPVVQQPAPAQVVAPVVAAPAQPAATVAGLPSVSVQGSVKIN